jgi:sulfite exporter TauE/SafE
MDFSPQILQMSLIGALWVSLHCGGMCGPIVASMTTHLHSGDSNSPGKALVSVLLYQTGRAVTYAILGLIAGGLGHSFSKGTGLYQSHLSFGLGIVFVAIAVSQLYQRSTSDASSETSGRLSRLFRQLVRDITGGLKGDSHLRVLVFGGLMGFLPCMLTFWVLGIAASTQHPLHGATTMLWLLLMTTPVLVAAGTAPMLVSRTLNWQPRYLKEAALMSSGLWLTLIGAASAGWISHASLKFELLGRPFTIMFW